MKRSPLSPKRGLDHRVAAALDLEAWLVGQLRRAPAALGGAMGVAGGDVDAGDGVGGGGDLRCGGDREDGQLLGVRGFGGERMAAGFDHPARLLVQLGRVEADHAGERLAMGEAAVGAHQPVGVPRRDLDMIAEHRIVADLERADAGRIAVARLERCDRAAAVGGGVAERVERGVIAFGDIAALRRIDRRRFDQRRAQAIGERGMAAELRQQLGEQRRAVALRFELGLQRGRGGEAVAQQGEVARASPAGGKPGQRAREIGHGFQRLAHPLAADRILVQPCGEREPRLDRRLVGQRRANILAQQAAAGGRLAAVDLAEQASGNAAADRARQLEAVAGRRVDRHVAGAGNPPRRVEQGAGRLLGRVEIGEQPAGGGKLGARRGAEPVERRQAEARLQRALAGEAVEPALAG